MAAMKPKKSTKKEQQTGIKHVDMKFENMACCLTETYACVGCMNGDVRVIDTINASTKIFRLKGHTNRITCIVSDGDNTNIGEGSRFRNRFYRRN